MTSSSATRDNLDPVAVRVIWKKMAAAAAAAAAAAETATTTTPDNVISEKRLGV